MSNKTKSFLKFFAKSKSNKLQTDSVPIDDDDGGRAEHQDIMHENDQNRFPISIYTRESSRESQVSGIDVATPPNTPHTSYLLSVNPTYSPSEIPNANSNLSLNQTQAYNVYQFSQINGLHIGSVYSINTNNGSNNNSNTTDRQDNQLFRKTKTIETMMKSTEPIVYKTMDIVSTHLGHGWRDVMRHLGHTDGQIEQLFEDNHVKGIKEVIYLFLLDYKRNDDDACLGHLTKTLWKTGHKETVHVLKKYWKNGDLNETNAVKSSQL